MTALGRHLQTPQVGEMRDEARGMARSMARLVKPAQHRAAGIGTQRLLGRPQRVADIGGAHNHHARQSDAGGGQRRRVRQVGWRNPDEAATLGGQARQRGPENAQLAYALVGGQNFGESTDRPAATGQLGVKRGKTAGKAGFAGGADRCAAPDAASLQNGGK